MLIPFCPSTPSTPSHHSTYTRDDLENSQKVARLTLLTGGGYDRILENLLATH